MYRQLRHFLLSLLCLTAAASLQLSAAAVANDDVNDTVALEMLMRMHGNCVSDDPEMDDKAVESFVDFGKKFASNEYVEEIQKCDKVEKLTCENVSSILNAVGESGKISGLDRMRLALPQLVLGMQNPECWKKRDEKGEEKGAITYLYSLTAVLVMKVAALSGIVTFPCMSAKVYTMALSFLVPLAISSLLGSCLFIFIPDVLELPSVPFYEDNHGSPILKLAAIGVGVYLFYMIEKFLRLVMERKEKQFYSNNNIVGGNYNLQLAEDIAKEKKSRKVSTTLAGDITSFPRDSVMTKRDSRVIELSGEELDKIQQKQQEEAANAQLPPIAWIAIMGDCIRNFIDGIAIGAAFSLSFPTGLSVSIAFIFEEIPTELGDVAILLNAGMSILRATFFHFAAASFAFIGAICGILLGDLGDTQVWIFAVSAGSFLYIALVDLMPEMNHALDSDKSREIGRLKIFLLQNLGLVLGFLVTGALGYFEEHLHIDFEGGGGHH